ncbi:MAG: putative Membrane protein [Labilithrix sp.]|nr:putative Membrane protein [Labilithrix sp.]
MQPESGNDAEVTREEQRALGWAAIAAVAIIVWLMSPVAMGMLLGALMAFTFQPIYERAVRRWPPAVAALATVLGSTLTVAVTLGGLAWFLVYDGTILGRRVIESLGSEGGARRVADAVSDVTSHIGISAEDLAARARTFVEAATTRAAGVAASIASTTASTVLALFFVMLTMYFMLRRWPLISATAQATLPLRPEYTRKLFEEFRRVGRTTLLSTLVIGVLQGTLATIGYWMAGLPRPVFFGALTAIASLVPGLGTLIVWVPAGLALVLLGHVGRGVLLLAWGPLVVTGIPDYVIRPRLVGHGSALPALLTFTALFGGAELLGLKGLIIGPVLMAIAVATLRLYADEARARRRDTSTPP